MRALVLYTDGFVISAGKWQKFFCQVCCSDSKVTGICPIGSAVIFFVQNIQIKNNVYIFGAVEQAAENGGCTNFSSKHRG